MDGVEPRRQYKYAWRKGEEKGEYVGIKGAIRSLEHIREAPMKKVINEGRRLNESHIREAKHKIRIVRERDKKYKLYYIKEYIYLIYVYLRKEITFLALKDARKSIS